MSKSILAKGLFYLTLPLSLMGGSASDADSLQSEIKKADDGTDTTITFLNDISLNPTQSNTPTLANPYAPMAGTISQLLPLGMNGKFQVQAMSSIKINGGGNRLDGSSFRQRGFFVRGGSVEFENLDFVDCRVIGGFPGGAKLGSALFLDENTSATLTNCSFEDCIAIGGVVEGQEYQVGD